jgi:branched-chain amino acid transport system ATP-binding protein
LILSLAGLSKSYGALAVTNNISLDVAAGAALGIIGPNGAGKSTLFNLITGDVKADSGIIKFQDQPIQSLPPHKRAALGIGRSYQIPQPFDGMTVLENLLVGAQFAGRARIANPKTHCGEILQTCGLAAKASLPAGRLTLLERKRLELARALATKPSLLLLDEIAGGLTDPEAAELVKTIKSIHAAGVTIIWIEHVLHALLPAVSRLVVLSFGQILADGAPQDIMSLPTVREIYLGIDEDLAA